MLSNLKRQLVSIAQQAMHQLRMCEVVHWLPVYGCDEIFAAQSSFVSRTTWTQNTLFQGSERRINLHKLGFTGLGR